jgi:outer membrane lipase/esterase
MLMSLPRPARVLALALVLALLTAGRAPAGLISGIVVFGDSLSDTGNAYTATSGVLPPSPYSAGRFSNGPIWVQQLASKLGVTSPAPSLKGGTDYAFAGAATGGTPLGTQLHSPAGTSPLTTPSGHFIANVPTLPTQVNSYLGSLHGAQISPSTAITIWAGANDFFDGQTDPTIPAKNIANAVSALLAAGAHNILVANLPDLSKTPFGLSSSTATQQGLSALSAGFNSALAADLSALGSAYGNTVHLLDTASLFKQIQTNPSQFGFSNVTGQGILTGNPSAPGYLFWDDVHPTTAGHQILANKAYSGLGAPEPSSLTLLAVGLVGLAGGAWKRRRVVG